MFQGVDENLENSSSSQNQRNESRGLRDGTMWLPYQNSNSTRKVGTRKIGFRPHTKLGAKVGISAWMKPKSEKVDLNIKEMRRKTQNSELETSFERGGILEKISGNNNSQIKLKYRYSGIQIKIENFKPRSIKYQKKVIDV